MMLDVEQIVEAREALVQPEMAPVLAGEQIAEPLVREFVRDEALAATEIFKRGRKHRVVVQRGERNVFHAAPVKILDANLVVLVPRIRHANLLLKKLHDGQRVGEGIHRVLDLRRRRPPVHGHLAVHRLDRLQAPGHEADEVVRHRLVLQPMHGHQAIRALLLGHLVPVRQCHDALGDVNDHFHGEFFVRIIVGGIPKARLVRLALRPDVHVLGFVAQLRRAEIKTTIWLGGIAHRHARLFAHRNGVSESHDHFLVRDLVAENLFRGSDGRDTEIHPIEF